MPGTTPLRDSVVVSATFDHSVSDGSVVMASADKISALRGMRDVFSAEYLHARRVQVRLAQHLRLHGYKPVDAPILENTELYLRKAGEDIAARLYEFDYRSRRVALRPEVTASILRAYVEHLQDEPLPLRLQYSGPVFRYEKPQQHRYRQFTLSGAELLGARGPRADAEIIHLACSGLERVGVRDYKLVIGYTGVLEGFLEGLGLRMQLVNFLLRNMENLRKRGIDAVVASLREIYPEYESAATAVSGDNADGKQSQQLINVLREMTDGEAHQAITDLLHSLNIRIDSNRAEGEVIERLLHKIREDQQAPKLQVALDFMGRLGELAGEPAEILPEARALAADFELDCGALDALGRTLVCLADYGAISGSIELDFGLNRGLHYYTGLIFELHCPTSAGEAIQICGGGRYDNLISILGGGEATPALGFAYGIERIASVLAAEAGAPAEAAAVAVIPVADDDFAAGFAIAEELRARGIAAEVSIDGRNLGRSLKRADRRGATLVIIIGGAERAAQTALLREMRSRRERPVALADLAETVEELLSADE